MSDNGVPVRGGARTAARFCAVQALYALEMARGSLSNVLDDIAQLMRDAEAVGNEMSHVAPDTVLLGALVTGTLREAARIDAAIARVLPQKRTVATLEAPLRALLRVAVYELCVLRETPPAVLLQEYGLLSAAFSGDTLPKFVRGVLSNVSLEALED